MYNQFFTIKPRISEKNGGSEVVHLIKFKYKDNKVYRKLQILFLFKFSYILLFSTIQRQLLTHMGIDYVYTEELILENDM